MATAVGMARKAGNQKRCNRRLMAHPKAPGKGLVNPPLPGGCWPHALPQPPHSPERCGPHPSAPDCAPAAARAPDT